MPLNEGRKQKLRIPRDTYKIPTKTCIYIPTNTFIYLYIPSYKGAFFEGFIYGLSMAYLGII